MAGCADPSAIAGATIVTSGPYNDTSVAIYQCLTGYVLQGNSFITCNNGAWTGTTPACSLQDTNQVYVTLNDDDNDIPSWLFIILAVVCGLLGLLLLSCIVLACCQLFGCFGRGGWFGEHQPGNCWCCRRNKSDSYDLQKRQCRTFPRRYEYDENGRRYHLDDLGRRCYYNHKNQYTNGKVVSYSDPETMTNDSQSQSPRGNFITAVNEVMVERKPPAKEVSGWMPHAKPMRHINTSTK